MSFRGRILGPVLIPARCTRTAMCSGIKKREFLLAGTGTLQLAVRNSNELETRRPTAVLHLSVLSVLELYLARALRGKIGEEEQKMQSSAV